MTYVVDRSQLAAALTAVAPVIKRSHNLYLDHVLLRAEGATLTVAGTCLDESVIATVEIEQRDGASGEVAAVAKPKRGVKRAAPTAQAEPGGVLTLLLPFKRLREVVNADSFEALTFSPGESAHAARIVGDGAYSLFGLDPADYPGLPDSAEVEEWGSLPLPALRDLLSRAKHACGEVDSRWHVGACLLRLKDGALSVCGMDGHRLWREDLPAEAARLPPDAGGENGVSIPLEAFGPIGAIEGGGAVEVGWTSEQKHLLLRSSGNGVVVAFRRREDKHPDYASHLERWARMETRRCEVDRALLEGALKRAAITAPDVPMAPVFLAVEDGVLSVRSEGAAGSTHCAVPVDDDGESWSLRICCAYLLDALGAVGSARVCLQSGHPMSDPLRVSQAVEEDKKPTRMEFIMPQHDKAQTTA